MRPVRAAAAGRGRDLRAQARQGRGATRLDASRPRRWRARCAPSIRGRWPKRWSAASACASTPRRALPLDHRQPPGTVLWRSRDGIDIACGDGALRLLQRAARRRPADHHRRLPQRPVAIEVVVSAAPGAALRALAARSLVAVLADGRSLKAELAEVLPQIADPRDRALFEAICFAALRHRRRYDAALSQWLARPLARSRLHRALPAAVRTRADRRVELAGARRGRRHGRSRARRRSRRAMVGLVNALLRRATARAAAGLDIAGGADLASGLAGRGASATTGPDSLRRSWTPTTSRGRCGCASTASRSAATPTLKLLLDAGGAATRARISRHALRIDARLSPESLPGWRAGSVQVQDGAAQLAVEALALRPDDRVLDACAAPGGKSAQIAERDRRRGFLLALDVDERRCARCARRSGACAWNRPASNCKAADAHAPDVWWDGRALRRDPARRAVLGDRHRPSPARHQVASARTDDLAALVAHAGAAARRAVDGARARRAAAVRHLLDPARRERSARSKRFLARTPDARAQPLDARFGRVSGAGRQRLPGEDGMDGFFYARLRKKA